MNGAVCERERERVRERVREMDGRDDSTYLAAPEGQVEEVKRAVPY